VEILPRTTVRKFVAVEQAQPIPAAEKLHRISTGAPLRVLG
jgi:hypothetical protein